MNFSTGSRIHGMDAIRAIAMYLGVILHASISYKQGFHNNFWVMDHEYTSYFFDIIYWWIHSFRMHLFFLIAGFFARLLYLKIGFKDFVKHRFIRIIIPFILAVYLIVPISKSIFNFYTNYYINHLDYSSSIISAKEVLISWLSFNISGPIAHIWFLDNLIFFYIFFLIFLLLSRFKLINWACTKIENLFIYFFSKSYGIIGIALPIIPLMFLYKTLTPYVVTTLMPSPIQLSYYGYFFALGILLHKFIEHYFTYYRYKWLYLIAGSLCAITTWVLVQYFTDNPATLTFLFKVLIKTLFVMSNFLLAFGFLGIMLKVFNRQNDLVRYFSDSSFWVYLIHLPIIVILQSLLIGSAIPGSLRFALVLIVTTCFCLVTYHFWVRYTIIGYFLHGRKYRIHKNKYVERKGLILESNQHAR